MARCLRLAPTGEIEKGRTLNIYCEDDVVCDNSLVKVISESMCIFDEQTEIKEENVMDVDTSPPTPPPPPAVMKKLSGKCNDISWGAWI